MISRKTTYLEAINLVTKAEMTAQKCEDRGWNDEAQKVREREL
jgi:hypothetical protein